MQHSSVPRWWRWAAVATATAAAQQNTSNVVQICPNSKRIEIRDNKVVGQYMYNLICTCLLFIYISVRSVIE